MGYADKNYIQKKHLYDVMSQVFEDYKYGAVSSGHKWNIPTNEIKGVTMRYLGESLLELTYHRYEVATVEELSRIKQKDVGLEFVAEVVKALKKEFKKQAGKPVTLKMVKEKPVYFEKAGRISAETSSLFAPRRSPSGRYLVRSSCVYDFSAKL